MSNDTNKINAALNSKAVKTSCTKCGGQQNISNQPFMLPVGTNGNLGQTVDLSTLVCSKCGHLDLFVDQILGV